MYIATGNIVKLNDRYIVIITDVDDDYVSWVSFDMSNVSGGTKMKTYMRSTSCFCCENNEGEYDEDCEDCKGTGSYKEEVPGMDKARVLASNAKEYILKNLTKNFEF